MSNLEESVKRLSLSAITTAKLFSGRRTRIELVVKKQKTLYNPKMIGKPNL